MGLIRCKFNAAICEAENKQIEHGRVWCQLFLENNRTPGRAQSLRFR